MMNFIIGLPLDACCNAIYTYVDKLTKFVKIICYIVGDEDLSAPATVKLFFNHDIC